MSGHNLSLLGCSCFLTFVGYGQASFISATLQVFLVNFRAFVLRCQHDSFPDPSCNFRGFVHDVSQGPSSNSQGHRRRKHIFVGGLNYFAVLPLVY